MRVPHLKLFLEAVKEKLFQGLFSLSLSLAVSFSGRCIINFCVNVYRYKSRRVMIQVFLCFACTGRWHFEVLIQICVNFRRRRE